MKYTITKKDFANNLKERRISPEEAKMLISRFPNFTESIIYGAIAGSKKREEVISRLISFYPKLDRQIIEIYFSILAEEGSIKKTALDNLIELYPHKEKMIRALRKEAPKPALSKRIRKVTKISDVYNYAKKSLKLGYVFMAIHTDMLYPVSIESFCLTEPDCVTIYHADLGKNNPSYMYDKTTAILSLEDALYQILDMDDEYTIYYVSGDVDHFQGSLEETLIEKHEKARKKLRTASRQAVKNTQMLYDRFNHVEGSLQANKDDTSCTLYFEFLDSYENVRKFAITHEETTDNDTLIRSERVALRFFLKGTKILNAEIMSYHYKEPDNTDIWINESNLMDDSYTVSIDDIGIKKRLDDFFDCLDLYEAQLLS